MYIAVPLTQNLPKTEAEKIMKYESWLWKSITSGSLMTNLYNPYLSVEEEVTKDWLKYPGWGKKQYYYIRVI